MLSSFHVGVCVIVCLCVCAAGYKFNDMCFLDDPVSASVFTFHSQSFFRTLINTESSMGAVQCTSGTQQMMRLMHMSLYV